MADRLLIVDFGSQVTQLIARRLREAGVYCEIHPFQSVDQAKLKQFDPKAIVLSGGPASVIEGAAPAADPAIFAAQVPVLGICRGLQLINVAFGGTLYQDIGTQTGSSVGHRARDAYERNFHDVTFAPESGLARLYPHAPGGRVNSIHHQAIRNLGRGLVAEAHSASDDIIEAIRWRGRSYVFGVQWHPEFLRAADDTVLDCTPILDEFLRAARR